MSGLDKMFDFNRDGKLDNWERAAQLQFMDEMMNDDEKSIFDDDDEIDTFASIVAIADVYDAMTAARSYRAPKCAFQVIAAFEDDGFQKYNPKVIFTFLQRVAACYNNSRVLLSDGTAGQIVYLNKNTLSRPIVDTVEHGLIDLSQSANKDLFIKAIL